MGVQPPFLYDPIKIKEFDPKAVTRASQQPKPRRVKPEGPLVSFNQHPDSYLILPYGKTNSKPMNPSVKKWIKWMRIFQLFLRCLEVLAAGGLLAMMIIIRGVDDVTGWIMRIVPGVAILHTIYGVYHLSRKAAGRTPASSASYMLFASFFDVSLIPFYAFSALAADVHQETWTVTLNNQELVVTFSEIVFVTATTAAGLHLISLVVSLYLAVTFRKITNLPPDMNPLEDNLTSRHKRSKSSISTAATLSSSEKRLSTPLEEKRSSGATYEDLSRPPTMPFFHTRTQSTNSCSTYKSTPPPSRDARSDLPSRQYQVSNSARSSVASGDLKRNSMYETGPPTPPKRSSMYETGPPTPPKRSSMYNTPTPPKRQSYTEVPMSDSKSYRSSRSMGKQPEGWYTSDSLAKARTRSSHSSSLKKGSYQALHQRNDSSDDLEYRLPNPLEANPPTPRHNYQPSRDSPLSEISNNRQTGDIADMSYEPEMSVEPLRESFKAKYYGDLKPATLQSWLEEGTADKCLLAPISQIKMVTTGREMHQESLQKRASEAHGAQDTGSQADCR
ncbi:hypothetical protein G7Y89_g1688 [Cudoniella acicularis]|uniref:Uncharacterized protein n=1 Tax=Cudoniella acicularis TaxID=354080 RepID=A0A8H4RUP8_9HELO|nr:hypothetical protein G7Y89_g1688 [Cudoniella acicularis]